MPRLTISLPDELRRPRGDTEGNNEAASRRLGSGIEGADETSQQILRWLACWAESDD